MTGWGSNLLFNFLQSFLNCNENLELCCIEASSKTLESNSYEQILVFGPTLIPSPLILQLAHAIEYASDIHKADHQNMNVNEYYVCVPISIQHTFLVNNTHYL